MFADRNSLPADQKNEKIHELITDEMITRAIALGIRVDKIPAMEKLNRFDGSESFYENYVQWQDARFLTEFSGKKAREGKCKQILVRLMERRLFKRVYSVDLDKFPTGIKAELSRYTETPENLKMSSGSKSRYLRVAKLLDSAIMRGRGGDPRYFKRNISSASFFYCPIRLSIVP